MSPEARPQVKNLSVFCIGDAGLVVASALRASDALCRLHVKCIGAESTVALGLAIRDRARKEMFVLEGVQLRRAWAELGIPAEGKQWDNKKVRVWRPITVLGAE